MKLSGAHEATKPVGTRHELYRLQLDDHMMYVSI